MIKEQKEKYTKVSFICGYKSMKNITLPSKVYAIDRNFVASLAHGDDPVMTVNFSSTLVIPKIKESLIKMKLGNLKVFSS